MHNEILIKFYWYMLIKQLNTQICESEYSKKWVIKSLLEMVCMNFTCQQQAQGTRRGETANLVSIITRRHNFASNYGISVLDHLCAKNMKPRLKRVILNSVKGKKGCYYGI